MPLKKIDSAVRQAIAAGIRPWDAAPPLYRLAWRLGFELRPPHYAGFASNAALLGSTYGLAMGAVGLAWAMRLPSWRPAAAVPVLATAAVVGIAFGLCMAALLRRRARLAQLPSWDRVADADGGEG